MTNIKRIFFFKLQNDKLFKTQIFILITLLTYKKKLENNIENTTTKKNVNKIITKKNVDETITKKNFFKKNE